LKRFVVALVIFEALILADVLSTIAALNLGGTELSPTFHIQGFAASLIVKLAFSVGAFPLYLVVYRYFRKKDASCVKALWIVLLFLIAFYSVVAYNNIIVAISLATT